MRKSCKEDLNTYFFVAKNYNYLKRVNSHRCNEESSKRFRPNTYFVSNKIGLPFFECKDCRTWGLSDISTYLETAVTCNTYVKDAVLKSAEYKSVVKGDYNNALYIAIAKLALREIHKSDETDYHFINTVNYRRKE